MSRPTFRILLFCLLSLTFAAAANAQATRTWVSGVGDDVNPCSRTAPCKTFAGAISKTAVNGEINCLDPAGYGAVTVTKSITIDCEDTQGSILGASVNGVIINITTATDTKKAVKIRGISFNGAGTGLSGIKVMAASNVFVEDVVIDGFTQDAIQASNSGAVQITVRNSVLRSNGGAGINAIPAPGATADVTVINSLLTKNTTGVAAASSGATIRISGNAIVYNKTGLANNGSGTAVISYRNNTIDANAVNGAATTTSGLQ